MRDQDNSELLNWKRAGCVNLHILLDKINSLPAFSVHTLRLIVPWKCYCTKQNLLKWRYRWRNGKFLWAQQTEEDKTCCKIALSLDRTMFGFVAYCLKHKNFRLKFNRLISIKALTENSMNPLILGNIPT